MLKGNQALPPLHSKYITQPHITSPDNFTAWPDSFSRRVILSRTSLLQSSSSALRGKRRSVYDTKDGKAESRSKRRRHQEGYVTMQMTRVPLHCQSTSIKEKSSTAASTENFLQQKIVRRTSPETDEETTKLFLNVLAKLGKRDAPLLAQEIKQLNVTEFPMDTMAEKLANKMITDHNAAKSSSDAAVDNSIDVAVMVRSLLSDLRQSLTNPTTEIMDKLEDFEEVSQSFGLQNAINHLDFLDQCISCLCTKLFKKNEEPFECDEQSKN